MGQITLTDEEQGLLQEILEDDLSDLRMEIRETDDRSFKEKLKHKEEVMKKILAALQ
jgi:hypothetical protein